MDPTIDTTKQAEMNMDMSFLDDIGGNFLRVEKEKDYEVYLYKPPRVEPDPFPPKGQENAGLTRRTYTFEFMGKLVEYSPGTTWEKEFKAECQAKKILCLPVKITWKKQGDGKQTIWNLKVSSLVE